MENLSQIDYCTRNIESVKISPTRQDARFQKLHELHHGGIYLYTSMITSRGFWILIMRRYVLLVNYLIAILEHIPNGTSTVEVIDVIIERDTKKLEMYRK